MFKRVNIFLVLLVWFLYGTPYSYALVCTQISSTLTKGAETAEVLSLQNFLSEKGYLVAAPNGYFGPGTVGAVKHFQKDNGISPTGSLGLITRKKIKELSCSISNSPTPSSLPPQSDRVSSSSLSADKMFPQIEGYMIKSTSSASTTCYSNGSCDQVATASYLSNDSHDSYDIKFQKRIKEPTHTYGSVTYSRVSGLCASQGSQGVALQPPLTNDQCLFAWATDGKYIISITHKFLLGNMTSSAQDQTTGLTKYYIDHFPPVTLKKSQ